MAIEIIVMASPGVRRVWMQKQSYNFLAYAQATASLPQLLKAESPPTNERVRGEEVTLKSRLLLITRVRQATLKFLATFVVNRPLGVESCCEPAPR